MMEHRDIEITENDIYLNVRRGYLIANNSQTKIYQIQISENKFSGVMFINGVKVITRKILYKITLYNVIILIHVKI